MQLRGRLGGGLFSFRSLARLFHLSTEMSRNSAAVWLRRSGLADTGRDTVNLDRLTRAVSTWALQTMLRRK
jgi:hypothetical protein